MRLSCSLVFIFFFQAEDGIRDLVRSRGLGDVYKRQGFMKPENNSNGSSFGLYVVTNTGGNFIQLRQSIGLSLIHI